MPLSWVLSWAGQGEDDPLNKVATAMVGVWPGNPGLCGPAWTAQAQAGALVPLPMAGPGVGGAQLGYTASIFGAQAGRGKGAGGGGQGGGNSTLPGASSAAGWAVAWRAATSSCTYMCNGTECRGQLH